MAEDERLPRGAKGDKGDQGDAGMPPKVRRAVIFLFLLNLLLTVVLLFAVIHYVNSEQAAQQQAAQKEVGALCADLGTMARIPPPAGDPKTNPARAYAQAEHRAWQGLYTSIRCR